MNVRYVVTRPSPRLPEPLRVAHEDACPASDVALRELLLAHCVRLEDLGLELVVGRRDVA